MTIRKKKPMTKRKESRREAGNGSNPYIAHEFKEQDTWRLFRIMSEFTLIRYRKNKRGDWNAAAVNL